MWHAQTVYAKLCIHRHRPSSRVSGSHGCAARPRRGGHFRTGSSGVPRLRVTRLKATTSTPTSGSWRIWSRRCSSSDRATPATAITATKRTLPCSPSLGLGSYRFSVEWSRIEPSRGHFSQAELDHYRRMVECCHEHGVAPAVTFVHSTVPLWFAENGRVAQLRRARTLRSLLLRLSRRPSGTVWPSLSRSTSHRSGRSSAASPGPRAISGARIPMLWKCMRTPHS